VRRLRGQDGMFEVQRILKAFVDAQWLAEFDARLAAYRAQLQGSPWRQSMKLNPPAGLHVRRELSGFRLQRLEVFNWGTFDGRVWTLRADGRNAC
jgi:hypothetical protein